MFEFYKRRDFGSLVSDTFQFFKVYGKNYFKNYFLLNGIWIILFVGVVAIGYRQFFMQLFQGNMDGETYLFEEYFQNNLLTLILIIVAFFILVLIITLVSYTYPVFYLKRVSESGKTGIRSDEILADMKHNIGKMLLFTLGMLFIVLPSLVVVMGINMVLVFIVVGFFLFFLVIPVCINIINFLLYDYFQNKKGFFSALGTAISAQFSYPKRNEKTPFWKYWGTMAVIIFINYVINTAFTMVPFLLLQFGLLTTTSTPGGFEENPFTGTLGVFFFLIYGISLIVSFVLSNLVLVASGLMYYDHRTDLQDRLDILEIDSIGKNDA